MPSFRRGIGIATGKGPPGKHRYGKANEPSAWIPRAPGLEAAEKQALVDSHAPYPWEG